MNHEPALAPVRVVPCRSATLESSATGAGCAPAPLRTLCSNCHLKDLCLPCGLSGDDLQRLDGLKFGRKRGWSFAQAEHIHELLQQGLSQREVAARMGMPPTTVRRAADAHRAMLEGND